MPIVRVSYRESLLPHRTPIEHLWLAKMGHVYPHDRGRNYSILLGEAIGGQILAERMPSSDVTQLMLAR